ncbi:hypothetical protein RHGRI_010309 [Rhododendron griersonianum]|uniref:Uncharacterized protein n=1 Tax=Rhododendron griersonianum TaxID=479676 RepID=A0AAV6KIN4_9ERIC|nr:hypothetical protein RHGRI_010309 [Rhododendron griersonianum]
MGYLSEPPPESVALIPPRIHEHQHHHYSSYINIYHHLNKAIYIYMSLQENYNKRLLATCDVTPVSYEALINSSKRISLKDQFWIVCKNHRSGVPMDFQSLVYARIFTGLSDRKYSGTPKFEKEEEDLNSRISMQCKTNRIESPRL